MAKGTSIQLSLFQRFISSLHRHSAMVKMCLFSHNGTNSRDKMGMTAFNDQSFSPYIETILWTYSPVFLQIKDIFDRETNPYPGFYVLEQNTSATARGWRCVPRSETTHYHGHIHVAPGQVHS